MTVYVDDLDLEGRLPGGLKVKWSHMWADSVGELEAMAELLELNPKWIQSKSIVHYDVTKSKRALAIKFGAVPLGLEAAVKNRLAIRKRMMNEAH